MLICPFLDAFLGDSVPRRVTPSQLQSQIRQAQARQRTAIQNVNREIHSYNSKVRQFNAERKRAIDDYNREIRAYNARRRANQARLSSALNGLRTRRPGIQDARVVDSAVDLSTAYQVLDGSDVDPLIADLAERETANSLGVANAMFGDGSDSYFSAQSLIDTKVAGLLSRYTAELCDRWSGAIFALNHENPDAARHFCGSSREIIADILNTEAADAEVLARFPNSELTSQGTPTRRAKVLYCLRRSGRSDSVIVDFEEANIKDLTTLFNDLNSGAHGPAGRFSPPQLIAIKTRVADAIEFVCEIASQ